MSSFSLFSSPSNSESGLQKLVRDLSVKNSINSAKVLADILKSSYAYAELRPLTEKLLIFIQNSNYKEAILILRTLESVVFDPSDLSDLFYAIMESIVDVPFDLTSVFFALCTKSLQQHPDLHLLVKSSSDVLFLTDYSGVPNILEFLAFCAQIEKDVRVPLVFSGLLEKILPNLNENDVYFKYVASMIDDTQVRKYLIDMGHLDGLLVSIIQSRLSENSLKCAEALFSKNDLLNLEKAQNACFATGFYGKILEIIRNQASSNESISIAMRILALVIRYKNIERSMIDPNMILSVVAARTTILDSSLVFFESLALSNQFMFPEDDFYLKYPAFLSFQSFCLFYSYLSFYCRRESHLDLNNFNCHNDDALKLLLMCSIQRQHLHKDALIFCQSHADAEIMNLSSINCLVCRQFPVNCGILVQNAVNFLANHSNIYPIAFIDWIEASFNEVTRMKWLQPHDVVLQTSYFALFERSPTESNKEASIIYAKAKDSHESVESLRETVQSMKKNLKNLEDEYQKVYLVISSLA